MTEQTRQARRHIDAFKGNSYVYGLGCFQKLGSLAASCGKRACVITSGMDKPWGEPIHQSTVHALEEAGVALAGDLIRGAQPNAPREDVFRLADALAEHAPDTVVAVGGGSVIDAAKAAMAFRTLRDCYPDLDAYFGVGEVSRMLTETGRTLPPLVAVQLASGSAAHLTKYANVTDTDAAQKMLIVDEAVVPPKCLFDYEMTTTMPPDFTMDGGLDGVSHCLEVYYGVPEAKASQAEPVCLLGIELIVGALKAACTDPEDTAAREAIGLGTDLGGYAIMIGGTNGGHLTSFSLVDLLPHGRACALMNPYYTVLFAPAIENRLRKVGAIYHRAGYTDTSLDHLHGRGLGLAVADAMLAHARDIGFPTKLGDVEGFTDNHITRALSAAKNPKLESKLKNMPVPLSAETVDEYMGSVLEAAKTGEPARVRSLTG